VRGPEKEETSAEKRLELLESWLCGREKCRDRFTPGNKGSEMEGKGAGPILRTFRGLPRVACLREGNKKGRERTSVKLKRKQLIQRSATEMARSG